MQVKKSIILGVIKRLQELPGLESIDQSKEDFLEFILHRKKIRLKIETRLSPLQFRSTKTTERYPTVWLAPYITKSQAKKLQQQNILYADTAGNIFLFSHTLYILKDSEEPPLLDTKPQRATGSVFNPSTTRVALHLLLQPDLLQKSLRTIASASEISLRSVQIALEVLTAEKCILNLGKDGYKYHNKELLFQKFVEGYNQKLRPKLMLARVSPVNDTLNKSITIDGCKACWGGEVGSEILINFLKPQEYDIYAYENHTSLMIRNRLTLDSQGDVKIYAACWPPQTESKENVAPAIVIYADLKFKQDPRCDETAEKLFDSIIRAQLNG